MLLHTILTVALCWQWATELDYVDCGQNHLPNVDNFQNLKKNDVSDYKFFCLKLKISNSLLNVDILDLHEIVEGLYFYCSVSVCLCVCVSVNKIPAERMHWFGRGFR